VTAGTLARLLLLVAVAAVPLAPLLPVPGTPLPQKQLLLLALAGAGAVCVWWQARRGDELPALETPVDGALMLWVAAILVAGALAPHTGLAAYGVGLVLASLVLYVVAVKSLRRPEHVRALYAVVFAVALVVSGFTLVGYARFLAEGAEEQARAAYLASSLFPHSYLCAQYLSMVVAGGAVMVLESGGLRRWRLVAALGLVPMAAALFVIGSRGSWLAVAVALGISTLLRASTRASGDRDRRRQIVRVLWRGSVAAAALVLVGLAVSLAGPLEGAADFAFERLAMLFDPQRAEFNYSRLGVWRDSLDMFADHVLLGVGPGAFETSFPPYHASAYGISHAHNQLVHLAAETGVAGLAAFLLLLRQARRTAVRGAAHLGADDERRGLFHAAVAALLTGTVYFLWETPLLWAESGSLLIVLLAVMSRAGCTSRDASTTRLRAALGVVLALVALKITMPITLDYLKATDHAVAAAEAEADAPQAADRAGYEERLTEAVSQLAQADADFPWGADIVAWRARLLLQLGRQEESLEVWREADARTPGTFEANSAIGTLLLKLGRPQEAIAPLRAAVIAHLGRQSAPTFARLASAYARSHQLEEAWYCYLALVGYFHFESVQPGILLDAADVLVQLQRLPLFAQRLLTMHGELVPGSADDPEVARLAAAAEELRRRGPRVLGD
jgi:O-antigen ligase